MSPAAQRLATSKLGLKTRATDKALRASYTPSPSHRSANHDRTPSDVTPSPGGSTRRSTNTGTTPGTRTPGSARAGSRGSTPKRTSQDTSSITDNLLNLPKRPRAEEFF